MKLVNGILIIIVSLLTFASCEEAFIRDEYDDNALDVFNAMWTTVDENYSFFSFKGIDWDAVYEANRPRVENGMRRDSLFNVLADMLFVLRDGHVNLQAGFDLSRNWDWYLDFPQNFDFTTIERNYLGDDYEITGPFKHRAIDSVGYIYYESFEDDFSESVADYLVTLYASRVTGEGDTLIFKGLIIDVRDNGGGSLNNANTLASRFADERRHVQNWQYKDGPGHNDFTEPVKKYIEPEGDFQYTNFPVVVLTNRSCYSATNFFVQIMKNFPNVTVMGDSTGGGGGLPVNRELPNGWTYRFSSTVTTTVAGENIEDGVAPDVRVDITDEDREAGRDTILEEALKLICQVFEDRQNQGA